MINIYQQPASLTFAIGAKVSFNIGADTNIDGGYVTYKWEWTAPDTNDWAAIQHPTATSATVIILPALVGVYNTNDFRCIISEYNNLGAKVGVDVISATAKAIRFDGRSSAEKTKSLDATKIRTNLARHNKFDPPTTLSDLFAAGELGGAVLDDANDLVDFSNTQSAILDVADGMRLAIGSVITERKNNDPSGKPQQTVLQFDGIINSPIGGSNVILGVFGKRVTMVDSAIAAQVKDQVQTILADYENLGLYVKNVTSLSATSISFDHRDHKDHVPPFWTQYGVTMTGIIGSPASKGYGQWQKFAETDITGLDTLVSKLYYWERIA